jgi:hypothetical protein
MQGDSVRKAYGLLQANSHSYSGPDDADKSTHIQTMLPDQFEGIFSFDNLGQEN